MLTILLSAACTKRTAVVIETLEPSKAETLYADLLQMQELEEGRVLCRIMDPWHTETIVAQYLLVPRSDAHWSETLKQTYDETYGVSTLLRIPLQHMTLTAGCHAWLMSELNALDCVSVMCDTSYVMAPVVKQWLRTHDVKDGGSSNSPNMEVMLQAQSDAVWISPLSTSNTSLLPSQANLPVIYCADYMENSPLGRAEWMKFYGRLTDQGQAADSLFQLVATRYDSIANNQTLKLSNTSNPSNPSTSSTSSPPQTLLAELPYGATWYVPGGRSTSVQLYQDAGFSYPWAEDTHAGSLSLSPEAVLAKAGNCDVWYFKYMNEGGDWTMDEFLKQNPYYSQFKATKEGEVWGCNTAVSDFFDVTPFRPDLLLESLRNKDGKWFRPIK